MKNTKQRVNNIVEIIKKSNCAILKDNHCLLGENGRHVRLKI